MTNTKKIFLAIATVTLSLGLTGCGKDNYEGTYTGLELPVASTTTPTPTQGGYQYPNQYPNQTSYGYGQYGANQVSLTLTNNGDVVSGNYTVTSTGMNSGYGNTSGTFRANSSNSGSLSDVYLLKSAPGGYQQCIYQGSLSSTNHGQTLTGTLSTAQVGVSGGQYSYCPSISLNLTRGN
jgi:hypothetical protein